LFVKLVLSWRIHYPLNQLLNPGTIKPGKFIVSHFNGQPNMLSLSIITSVPLLASENDGSGWFLGAPVIALYLYISGFRKWRRAVRMIDTPNVPPSAVPFGRAESTGIASLLPGKFPLGPKANCAYYAFKIEKYVRAGKHSHWALMAETKSHSDIYLDDSIGGIAVKTDGANVDIPSNVSVEAENMSHEQLFAATGNMVQFFNNSGKFDPNVPVKDLPGSWRVLEQMIPTGSTITVLGPVLPGPDPSIGVFRKDSTQRGHKGDLYIGLGDEKSVEKRNMKGRFRAVLGALGTGFAIFVLPITFSDSTTVSAGTEGYFVASGILGVFVSTALLLALAVLAALDQFNRIVILANQVEASWSMVDVSLARRSSLIPQLRNVVSGALDYEKQTLSAISAARWTQSRRVNVSKEAASAAVEADISTPLLALIENYPQMRTSENVLNLQKEIAVSENKIQAARATYNDAVGLFLTRLGQFPSSLFAGKFKDRQKEYWTL
jgi:LemA protein